MFAMVWRIDPSRLKTTSAPEGAATLLVPMIRDFAGSQRKHVIFLGGKKYNPQIPELPYLPAFMAERRKIRNLEPRNGEPAEYLTSSATPYGAITAEYALISVYPGLTEGTRLMTLDCSSTEGTLAAAEFLTREDLVRQLVARGIPLKASGGKYPAFQAIIQAKFNDSVPVELSCVTHRVMISSKNPESERD